MLIAQIIVSVSILILFRIIFWPKSKKWLLFILSLIAVFWLQTSSPIRTFSFWVPTITILLALITWKIVSLQNKPITKEDSVTLLIIFVLPILFCILKLIGLTEIPFIAISPNILALIITLGIVFLGWKLIGNKSFTSPFISSLFIIVIITFLIILKNQNLSKYLSGGLRNLSGQSIKLSSATDIVWVGFSYFAFRLIHTIIDRKRVEKLGLSLRDFITYLIFFPAYIAGPIDRIEHFNGELNRIDVSPLNEDFLLGGYRIIRGFFLKFIIADSLAILSLNSKIANSINNSLWMWLLVYAYAFRILFDFSGYTDIALGIAKIAGINLPENFKRPYLSRNITIFWNNWHITLTHWFRTYYFNPITRFLKINYKSLSPVIIIIFAQLSTMVLIGLWHGISWNFVIWGLWNGIGLFIHNRWSEIIGPKISMIKNKVFSVPYTILSIVLTFHFVALGWVWFSLPSLNESLLVFSKLF
jgi:alginate O-acetyltransferase complex protein AlgI